MPRQQGRHTQANRYVAVVAASVHDAGCLRNIVGRVFFRNRQRIDVKAQQDDWPPLSPPVPFGDRGDVPSSKPTTPVLPGLHFQPQFAQVTRNDARRADFAKAQLGWRCKSRRQAMRSPPIPVAPAM